MKMLLIAISLFLSSGVYAQETDTKPEETMVVEPLVVQPTVRAAESAPEELNESVLLKSGIEAYKSKNWPVFVSVAIMFILGIMNWLSFMPTVPSAWMPAANFAFGLAFSCSFNVIAGMDWISAVLQGLAAGGGASGAYSLFGKHILAKLPAKAKKKK